MSVRVLLVDDQELIREGLTIILNAEPDIEVVGVAADGREGVSQAKRLRPDVVLMDIKMPHMDGIEATRLIRTSLPSTPVVILTTYADDDLVFRGIRAGATGYLLKDIGRAKLAEAVRGAAAGEAQIDPSIAAKVLSEFQRMSSLLQRRAAAGPGPGRHEERGKGSLSGERYPIQALTPREESILQLLTEGLTNAGIAARLGLSEGTVKNHVSEILSKLHANDRTHAVVLAIKRGLLELE
jgi:DNA-binding NarL/FixJ family response regulator